MTRRLLLVLVGLFLPLGGTAEDIPLFDGLEYRLIGPQTSGRVSQVTGVPGGGTLWAAKAASGVWKSVNGGTVWEPVFDDQPVSSIGSIAVAPSDPNVVWVGTGEANIRGNVGEGNGIYRSNDAGKTWSHVWEAEGQIGAIIVHPENPDVVFAAVLGSPFGPTEERGVLRTLDGGRTWEKVLYVDQNTGASDVCFDPNNPRILFAGTWQARRKPWDMISGGPGSGLWTSRDGGDTWEQIGGEGLENGELPIGLWGRVGVRVAPSDSRRVYALIEAENGGLFRSDDGGETWSWANDSRGIRQRAWYYTTMTVDPRNADVVWFPQVGMLKTIDGGHTIRRVEAGGWDHHDVWIDPLNPHFIVEGSDAGVAFSRDGGETWDWAVMPTAQLYRVSVDNSKPYRVLGSVQDLGTVSGPSNSFRNTGILLSDWISVGGGEAGHVVADPSDPGIVWAGEYLGLLTRLDSRTRQRPHVGIYPENSSGQAIADLRYRFQWTAPIVISPHDPKTVYHAGNVLFRTRDNGQTWQAISPDLTRDDSTKQAWAGGPITGDNTGVEHYCTIFAVAESPVEKGLIWAGTDDGLVHITRDDGETWQNVTPSDLPEWATVRTVEPSRWNAGVAYLVADAHRLDDENPYLWKTDNFGKRWQRLGADLDPEVYLHMIREDTVQPGLLFLGTERGVLFSRDDGANWESLRLNMPTVAAVDLALTKHDLVVGTLGRSIWILDDLTPLREAVPEMAHFYAPPPAVRWTSDWGATYARNDAAGTNPPAGAQLTYYLPSEPKESLVLEVFDEAGELVRTLSDVAEPLVAGPEHPDWEPGDEPYADLTRFAGWNRVAWDLAHEPSRYVHGTAMDTYGPSAGPLVIPGRYTLKLHVDGQVLTQSLLVEADPRVNLDSENLEAQVAFLLQQRGQMNRVVEMAETIRDLRQQIAVQVERLEDNEKAAALRTQAEELSAKLYEVEEELHNPNAEVVYDVLAGRHGGAQLFPRLGWLVNGSLEHPGPPTQGMTEVAADLAKELAEREAQLEALLVGELAALNRAAAALGLPFVGVGSASD